MSASSYPHSTNCLITDCCSLCRSGYLANYFRKHCNSDPGLLAVLFECMADPKECFDARECPCTFLAPVFLPFRINIYYIIKLL